MKFKNHLKLIEPIEDPQERGAVLSRLEEYLPKLEDPSFTRDDLAKLRMEDEICLRTHEIMRILINNRGDVDKEERITKLEEDIGTITKQVNKLETNHLKHIDIAINNLQKEFNEFKNERQRNTNSI